MRRRILAGLLTCLAVVGCGDVREIGDRFRAERDLWTANREISRQKIRPDLVTNDERRSALDRYERIIDIYSSIPARSDSSEAARASREIHAMVARAMLTAARLQAEMGDSTGMLAKYDRIEREFSDLPIVAGEVAFARGQLAEAQGNWASAAAAYQGIVDRVEPDPLSPALSGMVMTLPLKIVSLRLLAAGEGAQPEPYLREADRYYQKVIATKAGTLAEADARWYRATVARDLGDPDLALRELGAMERLINKSSPPPRDPSQIRLMTIEIEDGRGASPDTIVAMGRRLIRDYPDSKLAPRTLLAMAFSLVKARRTDEGLKVLDEIEENYSNHVEVAAMAMQARGRTLQEAGRWPEALTALNTLQVSYPLTSPALLAPLEIASHYEKTGDLASRDRALAEAEQNYRSFLERYPENDLQLEARGRLVQTLVAQKKFEEAVTEMTSLGESMIKSPQGVRCLLDAARIALGELADTTRAANLLERVAKEHPGTPVGDASASEARKLRGSGQN